MITRTSLYYRWLLAHTGTYQCIALEVFSTMQIFNAASKLGAALYMVFTPGDRGAAQGMWIMTKCWFASVFPL